MVSEVDPSSDGAQKLNHASILRKRAEAYKKAKRIEDAMSLMSRAAEIEKGRSPKNYWRDTGLCLCEMGNHEEAIECFDKDLQLNGNSFETYYAKGIALYVLEIHQEALECLYKAYEMKQSEKLRSDAQVESLKSYKRFEEVIKHFSSKHSSSPHDYLIWYYLGLVLFQLARYSEAAESFGRAAQSKTDALVLYDWAKCELMLNHRDKALELLENASNHDHAIGKMLRVDPAFDAVRNNHRFRALLDHKTMFT